MSVCVCGVVWGGGGGEGRDKSRSIFKSSSLAVAAGREGELA